MTLDELKAKLGKELEAQAILYGPTVLKMGSADLQAWLNYVFVGQYTEAYSLYLKALGPNSILSEWASIHAEWVKANDANATKIELSNKIAMAFCQAMLAVVLAAVGL